MSDFTFNLNLPPWTPSSGAAAGQPLTEDFPAAAAGPTAQEVAERYAATGLDKKEKKPTRTGRVRGLSKKRKAKKEAQRDNPLSAAAAATVESGVRAASGFPLNLKAPEWTPSAQFGTPSAQSLKFISEPSTNINTLLGQSFYHIDATNMRVIPNNQNILYPKNNIYGNFSNDACLKLLKYLTLTTLNSNRLHSTEAFIILNDTIFYGYGFKNLHTAGNVPIHVETFLMLNLVKAIEKGKIQGVDSITIYSTLQPCCMCSLIIYQGIMYLRKLLNSDILCNIFYCNKDGAMKVFPRPGQNQPPSYWNYTRNMSLKKGPGQRVPPKTTLINHLCLVPGQTGSQIRLGANDYTLRQMFDREQNGQIVPTQESLNLLKRKFFHSDTTKLAIVGNNYRKHIGSEINVSYQPYDIRKIAKSDLEQIRQDTETFKLLEIINYFYLNATRYNRFGINSGTYNIIDARKIDTFLSGFTLLNAPPDCPERIIDLKTPTGTTTEQQQQQQQQQQAKEIKLLPI